MARSLKQYTWQGIDAAGKRIVGTEYAKDDAALKAQLYQRNITPLFMQKKFQLPLGWGQAGIQLRDRIDFTRQLAILMDAGITLAPALKTLVPMQTNPRMQQMLMTLQHLLESGVPFSEALNHYPQHFSPLYRSLIYSGEQSGKMYAMLQQIVIHLENQQNLISKIKKALFYPCVVLVIALGITMILLLVVVPQFQQLFQGFGGHLPAYTQAVITLAQTLRQYAWQIIFGMIILIPILWRMIRQLFIAKTGLQRFLLHLPWCGKIWQCAIIARITQTLALTLQAQLPISEAFHLIAANSDNLIYQQALLQSKEKIIAGESIRIALEQTGLFPPRDLQMLAIGEETATLPFMLEKISDFHATELRNKMDRLTQLIEPILMVLLGLIIGALIIAMYLPIFQIGLVM